MQGTHTSSSFPPAVWVSAETSLPSAWRPGFAAREAPTDPWADAVSLEQVARIQEGSAERSLTPLLGPAIAHRRGAALETRLRALRRLEESGDFTAPLYRSIFRNAATAALAPTVAIVSAASQSLFADGVRRTLASVLPDGQDRTATLAWRRTTGQRSGLLGQVLDCATHAVVLLGRDVLADHAFVGELLRALDRVADCQEAPFPLTRLQCVLLDGVPDLRETGESGWSAAWAELADELGHSGVAVLAPALRRVPLIAGARVLPGPIAAGVLHGLPGAPFK